MFFLCPFLYNEGTILFQREENLKMKVYQAPEAWLTLLTVEDVIATSGQGDFFVDDQGNDDNVIEWWG